MEQLGEFQSLHNGKEWILKLQNWLEADGAKDKEYDDSGYSEQPEWEPERYVQVILFQSILLTGNKFL